MDITRPRILMTLALGLIAGGFIAASALADDKSEHSHGAHGSHATKHEHDTMKAEKEISKALAKLSAADRKQVVAQRFCPIMEYSRLGADGAPHKLMIGGISVFVCCEGCIEDAVKGGKATLIKASKLTKASASMAKLPVKYRAAVEAQKYCAIANKNLLGSMGKPILLKLNDKEVFLCCKGCIKKANADPIGTLAKVEALKKAAQGEGHGHDEHGHGEHGHGDHKH